MTIKDFISKAIEGGWRYGRADEVEKFEMSSDPNYARFYGLIGGRNKFGAVLVSHVSELFLDPLFWQAVGKMEGWKMPFEGHKKCEECGYVPWQRKNNHGFDCSKNEDFNEIAWEYQMHRMIDALAEGKTLEAFVETL